jgi:molybdopterin-guanine dinucleotide biosynthesis protein MobB
MRKIPLISFVGKSCSGKTTLLEKVIKELKSTGLRLAVIKHDAHSFEIDYPGKDSWRHAKAGADIVVISSPKKVAIIEERISELSLQDIIKRIDNVDIILTEGYKRENSPKIEVFRSTVHKELLCSPCELLALASDVPWDIGVPYYDINDVIGIVDLIKKYIISFKED